ncbi:MAG: NUDIX hydrolase [Armatimonadetes bacterium]|nr:NUDIX hydrolase [Armatimonadota bacterium]
MSEPIAEILETKEVFHKRIFRWLSIRFRAKKFDGTLSEPIEHLVLNRGDSVGILLHDLATDEIVLVEQFRVSAIENGPGRLLEIPAGRIDDGESAEASAKREAIEETGAEPESIQLVASFYLSPGACTERLSLFYCPFPTGLTVLAHAGLAHESEDLRVHRVPTPEADEMVKNGTIIDAKSIIAIQWLLAHRQT